MSRIDVISEVGRGTFGVTYLAKNAEGKNIALKVIDVRKAVQNGMDIPKLMFEINALITLSSDPKCHPYIACYNDYFIDKVDGRECLMIISEYVDGPTLETLLAAHQKRNMPFDPNELWTYMYQLLTAVNYIHKMGFAHRDLKPENIILNTATNQLKIVDFGLSCERECQDKSGTVYWIPPELFLEGFVPTLTTSQAHDIWSLGVIFYEMANLHLPYSLPDGAKSSYRSIMAAIRSPFTTSRYRNLENPKRNFAINFIINSMLNKNWRHRPTAEKLLETMNDEMRVTGPVV